MLGGAAESRMIMAAISDQHIIRHCGEASSSKRCISLLLVGEMWIVSGGMDSAAGESAVRRFRGPGI